MLAQVSLVQTFVEELLALKQIQEQGLTLAPATFNPNEIFNLMRDVFAPQANGKRISMSFPDSQLQGNMQNGSKPTWPLPHLLGDSRRF